MRNIKICGSYVSLKLNLLKYKPAYLIYDAKLGQYASKVLSGCPSYALDADEKNKNIDTVTDICRWLLSEGAGRDAVLIALGGGVTTDIVGFAASIYKRGVRYVNIPTSLLAMVDAAVGGKTGVNLDDFKNVVGTVRQSEKCLIFPEFLSTLPERELRSGAAEMLKTFIIRNRNRNYEKTLHLFSHPLDIKTLEPLIKSAVEVKYGIVRRDPDERGPRRVLNLGHTIAHAIEWWQAGKAEAYTHGEAVAIGIVQAARKSEEAGIAKPGLADKLAGDFSRIGLPVEMPCPEEELLRAERQDKKMEGGKINYVFIKDIGNVTVRKI